MRTRHLKIVSVLLIILGISFLATSVAFVCTDELVTYGTRTWTAGALILCVGFFVRMHHAKRLRRTGRLN